MNKGFTFIELLIYISIITIMMMTLIPFAWNVIEGGAKSSVQQEVSSQGRYVSERLKYEIRNAVDLNAGTSNFGVNLALNSANQLSLKKNAPNDPTLINVLNGKVQIKQGLGTAVALNSVDTTVTNLTFTNYTSVDTKTKHIGFTLTITDNYTGSRQEFKNDITLESSAEMRSN